MVRVKWRLLGGRGAGLLGVVGVEACDGVDFFFVDEDFCIVHEILDDLCSGEFSPVHDDVIDDELSIVLYRSFFSWF